MAKKYLSMSTPIHSCRYCENEATHTLNIDGGKIQSVCKPCGIREVNKEKVTTKITHESSIL